MKKTIPFISLGVRLVMLDDLVHRLNSAVRNTKAYHAEVMVKIAAMAHIEGFDVTLTPIMEKEVAIAVMWSCEKRQDGISLNELEEIGLAIGNVEAVGLKKVDVQHDTHKVHATFRVR